MEKFDLTTKKGLQLAQSYLNATPLGMAMKVFDMVFNSDASKQQAEAVEKLIKQGKERGVKKMQIKNKNLKGFKLNAPIL